MEQETAPSPETPPGDGPAATNGSADVQGIAATLRSEMPEVQPHAVAAARAEAETSAGKDINGDSFNTAMHVAGPDGKGKKNAKGAWEKKRGRKAGAATTPGSSGNSTASRVGTGTSAPASAGPTKEQLARQSGVGAANLFFVAGIILGGEEWQPQADPKIGLDEKVMMEGAFGDYFVATGKTDLPPGWALVAAMGMFAARRFTMPKTQSRFTKLKTWAGGKILAWRMRKRKSTVQPYDKVDGEADPRDRRVWRGAGTPHNDSSTV